MKREKKLRTRLSFSGTQLLRVVVLDATGRVVGELRRTPKRAWSDGPSNTYHFSPNDAGVAAGLVSSRAYSIRDAFGRAQAAGD